MIKENFILQRYKMTLEEIFSEENLLAYSRACLELAIRIPDTRAHKLDFDTLVIPSRGAVPLFLGLCYSLNHLKQFGSDQEEFYNSLRVQKILSSLLPEHLKISSDTNHNYGIKTVVVPFTADLNLEKYKPEENVEAYVSATRDYWARVTASFFKDPNHRKKDPYFVSFVDFILRDIENRGDVASVYESVPQIRKFSLIDTVISGRASHDILRSFEDISLEQRNPHLNPYAFLIVDENGQKLKKDFRNYLTRKRLQDNADIQEIPRIVSEDEGASLLGVASTVYPSIMSASKNLFLNGKNFFVGAGSWHPGYELSANHKESFSSFMDLVYAGIDHLFAVDYSSCNESQTHDKFLEARQNFLEHRNENIKNFRLDSIDSGLNTFNINNHYHPSGVYETKSHVVHIPFDEPSNYEGMKRLGSLTGVKHIETPKSR